MANGYRTTTRGNVGCTSVSIVCSKDNKTSSGMSESSRTGHDSFEGQSFSSRSGRGEEKATVGYRAR